MILSEKYKIEYDDNNVVLVFFEERIREKKNKTKETYVFEDKFYYPTLKQALKAFLNKSVKYSKDISDVLDKIHRVELIISKL